MTRTAALFWAHLRASLFVLWDLLLDTITFADPRMKPGLQIYSRWSGERVRGRERLVTREVSVGFWTAWLTTSPPEWKRLKTYFLEVYDKEKKLWIRVK